MQTRTNEPALDWRLPRIDLAKILTFAAVVEVGTAIVALVVPATAVRWLLGEAPSSTVARCFGIALLALGAACWPGPHRDAVQAFRAMWIYNASIALYLTGVSLIGHHGGPLLWPAVALHTVVTIGLVWARPRLPRQAPGKLRGQSRPAPPGT
jgi:hypothetical protein